MSPSHPLDNPAWHALNGPQARYANGRGLARHYQREFAPFSAIAEASAEAYADLAADLPAGGDARLFRPALEPLPEGWQHLEDFSLIQMVGSDRAPPPESGGAEIVTLSPADGAEMQALVALAEPGPFSARTPELGRYIGVREQGRLIAMAGQRMRLPGHVELSAICTAPEARGRGLAGQLVRELQRLALADGELPFLHVRATNRSALALYEKLGFSVRTELKILRRRPLA